MALSHWGVIRAQGTDAASFLQGQLTNDVAGLDNARARLAGYCSAKGRLLASFVVWRPSADEFLLACHASVLASTLKRLSMFVLRAKCRLSDASADVPLFGVAGETAAALIGDSAVWHHASVDGASLIRLPGAAGVPRAWITQRAPPGPALALDIWRWLEVQSGIPTIEAATSDHFVPQMINFELVGGVDFQKGCYPGQEVVARSQYRGTVKRRLFLFDAADVAEPGQEIFHSADAGQPAGRVANAAAAPHGSSLLAEVKLAALAEGSLHLGVAKGPLLTRRELPYPLPQA